MKFETEVGYSLDEQRLGYVVWRQINGPLGNADWWALIWSPSAGFRMITNFCAGNASYLPSNWTLV